MGAQECKSRVPVSIASVLFLRWLLFFFLPLLSTTTRLRRYARLAVILPFPFILPCSHTPHTTTAHGQPNHIQRNTFRHPQSPESLIHLPHLSISITISFVLIHLTCTIVNIP
ncbi:hypothetical protein M413DRAFT_443624 [Hebeloma cylindrosporum]|uniref:Uncharacterized protein n=1 Tax=Hebeloma cylindrosporum TaxID=76867 RepID=A0A0C3CJ32_HEBCY|nr:hypothetical protein M413DRAFT_443624 [Hebeloma cylindrosporum h7]